MKRRIIGLTQRFDPNARDGDGDGLVQELTPYERPAQAKRRRQLGGAIKYNAQQAAEIKKRNDDIYKMFNDGATSAQIQEKYNLNTQQVTWILNQGRKRGLVGPARQGVKKPEQQDRNKKIADMYRSGRTAKEIAKDMDLPIGVVNWALRRQGIYGISGQSPFSQEAKKRKELEERNAEILKLHNDGLSHRKIGERFNIGPKAVERIVRRGRKNNLVGEPRRGVSTPRKQQRNQQIADLYNEGNTPSKIAQTLNLPVTTVTGALRQLGIYKDDKRTPPKKRMELPPKTRTAEVDKYEMVNNPVEADILKRYDSGQSVNDIGKALKIPSNDVLQVLVKHRYPDENGRMSIPKKPKQNRLGGGIRRPEPEIWELDNQSKPIPFFNTEDEDELYDLGDGPKEQGDIEELSRELTPVVQSLINDIYDELTYRKYTNLSPSASDKNKIRRNRVKKVKGLKKGEKRAFTQHRRQMIIEELIRGEMVIEDIASTFDVTSDYVINIKSQHTKGAKRITKRAALELAERNEKIYDDFLQGMSIDVMSEKYDLNKVHLRNIIRRLHTEKTGITTNPFKADPEKLKEEIFRRIDDGQVIAIIATALGINVNKVRKIAREKLQKIQRAEESRFQESEKQRRAISGQRYSRTDSARQDALDIQNERPPTGGGMAIPRKSPTPTAGLLGGGMANESPFYGNSIPVFIQKNPQSLTVRYGEIEVEVPINFEQPESAWTDAYENWVGWRGNFSMRNISAAILGLPLPQSYGYIGKPEYPGDSEHELVGNGSTQNVSEAARGYVREFEQALKDSVVALMRIDDGRDVTTHPIYRGLAATQPTDKINNLKPGDVVVFGLSAFTPSFNGALDFAKDDITPEGAVIVELLPGAKYAPAMGEQYLHEFMRDGQWVTDITEYVTQGKFEYVGSRIQRFRDGTTVNRVTLRQTETFDPVEGSFNTLGYRPRHLGGAMSNDDIKKRKQAESQKVQIVRPVIQKATPRTMDELEEQIKLNALNSSPLWNLYQLQVDNFGVPDGANLPNGEKMSRIEYLDYLRAAFEIEIEKLFSSKVNDYKVDFTPEKLEQIQYMAEQTILNSPELLRALQQLGFPVFTIFKRQKATLKEKKKETVTFIDNDEAVARNTPGRVLGTTIQSIGFIGLHATSDDFVPKQESDTASSLMQYISGNQSKMFYGYDSAVLAGLDNGISQIEALQTDINLSKENLSLSPPLNVAHLEIPQAVIRHEIVHHLHIKQLHAIKKWLDELDIHTNMEKYPNRQPGSLRPMTFDERQQKQEYEYALSLLTMMMSSRWSDLPQDIRALIPETEIISTYGASAPIEWVAETLSAALSPSAQMRALVKPQSRAVLSVMFPVFKDYLTKGVWP